MMMLISQNLETREVWDLSKVALLGQAGSRVWATNEYSILWLSNQPVHRLWATHWLSTTWTGRDCDESSVTGLGGGVL